MTDYLIYFAQAYPEFRRAELESLADLHNIKLDLLHHNPASPFLVVQLQDDAEAQKLVQRAVLTRGIYELWGHGETLEQMHDSIRLMSGHRFSERRNNLFRFDFEGYMGTKTREQKTEVIELFAYLGYQGKVRMKNPDDVYTVLEMYQTNGQTRAETPLRMWFGRLVQRSARTNGVLDQYDLRRRKYIGTTSFDAELCLASCNIAQVAGGKIVYDPFAGTGSFMVTAAHFGGLSIGSDIDIRMLKGKGDRDIAANFRQYGTLLHFLDTLTMDFTNNALRKSFSIDTIVCDPPYGVREGLRVCGARDPAKAAGREDVVIDGEKAHLRRDFIPPKKPYELSDLLGDLLEFAANRLPVGGRLAFWMPTANDEFQPHHVPQHERLVLMYNLEQEFNKWSRRLLVYRRAEGIRGTTLNALKENVHFRERYFSRFNEKSREGTRE